RTKSDTIPRYCSPALAPGSRPGLALPSVAWCQTLFLVSKTARKNQEQSLTPSPEDRLLRIADSRGSRSRDGKCLQGLLQICFTLYGVRLLHQHVYGDT